MTFSYKIRKAKGGLTLWTFETYINGKQVTQSDAWFKSVDLALSHLMKYTESRITVEIERG